MFVGLPDYQITKSLPISIRWYLQIPQMVGGVKPGGDDSGWGKVDPRASSLRPLNPAQQVVLTISCQTTGNMGYDEDMRVYVEERL